MDIFNTPYLYAKRYVTKTMLDNDIFVFPRFDGDRDDKYQNYIISYPDLVASIAANIPGAGVTSVTLNNLNPLFTVANTGTVTDPIFTFTAVPQNANLVYAGPAAGPAAAPTFRALTLADMPAGIDAQNLANVLSVGNATNNIPIRSNNSQSQLQVADTIMSMAWINGAIFGSFNASDGGAYHTFSDLTGNGAVNVFGGVTVISHTASVSIAAPTVSLYNTVDAYLQLQPGGIITYTADNFVGAQGKFYGDPTKMSIGFDIYSITIDANYATFDALNYKFTQLSADTAVYINSLSELVTIPFTANGDVFTLAGGIPTWAPLPGSTLATCLLDFYVTNINSCSPLHINPTNGQDVYMVEAGGKVGVGTAAPVATLEVVGQSTLDTTYSFRAGSQGFVSMQVTDNLNTYVRKLVVDNGASWVTGLEGSNVNAVFVSQNGASINNFASLPIIILPRNAVNGTKSGIDFRSHGNGFGSTFGVEHVSATFNDFVWWGFTGTAEQENMRLTNAGDLGVGTITPSAKLHVVGQTSDATTHAIKAQDSTLNLNFYVQNDGAVSSRLGYWLGNVLSYTNGGHITSIYGGYLAGLTANAGTTFNTVLGFNALAAVASVGNTAIGAYSAQSYTGDSITAVGYNAALANVSGISVTAIGVQSLSAATGNENTAVGFFAGQGITLGGYNTFIGSRAGSAGAFQGNQSYSIAIGYYAYTTADNQCVIGNQQGFAHISEFVLGYGPDQSAFTIGDTMIRPTNVRAGFTDIANDYNIIYAGGKGTGTGKGSDIIFKVAPAGATGSTQNPYVEILRFKNTGIINVASMQTGNAGLASGDLYVDTAANILANGDLVVGRKV